MKYIFAAFFFLLFCYMLLPGPGDVNEFTPLPNSVPSSEPGDTTQVPQVKAYFSDFFRIDVIPFYKENFLDKFDDFGLKMPFIQVNYPPQEANNVIRQYVQSWYLEELIHPLRESLYINGWEPFDEMGRPRLNISHGIVVNGRSFKSKVTLRYFPSPIFIRLIVWAGIVGSSLLLWQMYKKVAKTQS